MSLVGSVGNTWSEFILSSKEFTWEKGCDAGDL